MDARVTEYLASLEEPKRRTLAELRQTILDLVPQAQECISYGMPAYQVGRTTIAGFAAFKDHLSYLPHSGSVLDTIGDELGDYQRTKGSLHFPVDRPLPRRLVALLLDTRMTQAGLPFSDREVVDLHLGEAGPVGEPDVDVRDVTE